MAKVVHKKTAKATQPIIDITQPGKSLPSDSSKSIIVNNRSVIQDPMMNTPGGEALVAGPPLLDMEPQTHEAKAPSHKKVEIIPPSEQAVEETAPEAELDEATAPEDEATAPAEKPVAADSIPEPVKAPVAEPEAKPKTTETSEPDEAVSDALPIIDEKQLAADAAQAAKIDNLIKHEVYALPINAVERRNAQRFVVGGFILIVLLALAWLDLAADAGFIHVSHLPLTHFFRV